MILFLAGCMTMDSFFFNPTAVDAYELGGDVIPAEQVEEVTFTTADGATLYGVWAHQDDPDAPVFLHFHGNTGNIDGYWERVELYWSLGFETFIFDYRGYGRSEGTSTWDSVREDAEGAVAYVSDTTGLPTESITFHGESLGGAAAVMAAGTTTPQVLITEDMFSQADDLIDNATGLDLPSGWFLEAPFDNVANVPLVHAPYLVMHAQEDTYIRPDAANEVYDAANDPKALWFAPGCEHAEIPTCQPEDYVTYLTCWMAQDCVGL